MSASRMRSPLGRAIGLGSAKEGVEHWWAQRVTAVALVPLSVWFVIFLLQLLGADLATARHALGRPVPAVLLMLLVIAIFYHTALGLQVVIEDYIHAEFARVALVVAMRLLCCLFAVAGLFAVLRLAFLT